jgi:multicomponent Na+:H+ antiporter subunit E
MACGQSRRGEDAVMPVVRTTALLFALWLLLSGRREPWLLAIGLCAAAAIAWLHGRQPGLPDLIIPFVPFMRYLPWLLLRIAASNVHVARLILDPRLPIAPRLIRYPTRLHSPAALTLLANSITLTPGTITVEARPAELVVHALDEPSASDLTTGTLEQRIAWVFQGRGA